MSKQDSSLKTHEEQWNNLFAATETHMKQLRARIHVTEHKLNLHLSVATVSDSFSLSLSLSLSLFLFISQK